ncbi:hypothetical protein Trydic_g12702 [Trypoxylus dichotomus]
MSRGSYRSEATEDETRATDEGAEKAGGERGDNSCHLTTSTGLCVGSFIGAPNWIRAERQDGGRTRRPKTRIRNILQQISSDNHQYNETEWIDEDDDLLPIRHVHEKLSFYDDSFSNDETVINVPKVKHEDAISSFSTCIKSTEETGAGLGTVHTLKLMRERTMEAKQLKC